MLTVHITAVFFALIMLFFADKEAFSYMRGSKQTLDREFTESLHNATWVVLGILIVTGILLALPQWQILITNLLFIIKILFVGMLVTNAVIIGRLMPISFVRPWASLTEEEHMMLMLTGAISAFAWVGTITAALFALR